MAKSRTRLHAELSQQITQDPITGEITLIETTGGTEFTDSITVLNDATIGNGETTDQFIANTQDVFLGGSTTVGVANANINVSGGSNSTFNIFNATTATSARVNMMNAPGGQLDLFAGGGAGTFNLGTGTGNLTATFGNGSGDDILINATTEFDQASQFDSTLSLNGAVTWGSTSTITGTMTPSTAGADLGTSSDPFGSMFSDEATMGNIQVGVTNDQTLDTSSGNLVLASAGGTITVSDTVNAGTNVVTCGQLNADQIRLDGDTLSTTTGNLTINSAGTTTLSDNTTISGTLNVAGATTLDGNVTLGNHTGDEIAFSGRVSTGIDPNADNTLNLGTSALRFNTMFSRIFQGEATTARYADLAENYVADAEYDEGTVLVFGGSKEVTTTAKVEDTRVVGVISTKPAYLMNSELEAEFVATIALKGRVPVKVVGEVEKGDMLVASETPGYAVVSRDPKVGSVIGKAIEAKKTAAAGVVEAVIL